MSNYEWVRKLLEENPRARERAMRTDCIVERLIEERFFVTLSEVHRRSLIELCKEYASKEREWRDVVIFEPRLRGNDFKDGKELEDDFLVGHGYGNNRKIHA